MLTHLSARLYVLGIVGLVLLMGWGGCLGGKAAAEPKGQMVIAVDFSIAPAWFDPAETPALATPYIFLYALHDALTKALPGNAMAPSLAESWTESPDGLVYEFKLREGLRFHNGDPFTAEDVKFSFERYKGVSTAAKTCQNLLGGPVVHRLSRAVGPEIPLARPPGAAGGGTGY